MTPTPSTMPPPRPAPAGSSTRIAQIRRRRHLRQLRFALVCLVLLVLLTAYFTGALGVPLSHVEEWIDTVQIFLSRGASLPITHGVEGVTAVRPLSGGTAVLGRRELVLYASNGAELRRVPHGYDRVSITSGDTRVCIYNRGAKQLLVEGRTRNLYTATMPEPITLAHMSDNGTLAVATKSKLTVYDTLYRPVWTWSDTAENPIAMAFGPDNRRLAVACLYAQDGALGTKLHLFDTGSKKEGVQITTTEGLALQMKYLSRSRLLVVYDTYAAVYDVASGEEKARYDYGHRVLQSASLEGGRHTALLFGLDGYTSLSTLVVLDDTLQETGVVTAQMRADSVYAMQNTVQILADTTVHTYGLDGTLYGTTTLETKPLGISHGRGELVVTAGQILPFTVPGRPAQARRPQPISSSTAQQASSLSSPAASQ